VKRKIDSPALAVFLRREWQAQRVAWALMALVLLAALAGLLGSGPLSPTSVTSADGAVRVDYERFVRRDTRTTVRVHLRPASAESSTLALWLARPYLEGMKVDSVLPPPRRVQGAGDRITWGFEVSPREPREQLTVTIHLVPEGSGTRWAGIGLEAGPGVRFRQWVYP
jgi:hypothetical protein